VFALLARIDDTISRILLFSMVIFGLAGIWLQYRPQPNEVSYYFWLLAYVVINLFLSKLAQTITTIIVWLLTVPLLFSLALLGTEQDVSRVEGIYQYAILVISYATIWGYGAFNFNDKQYKVAVSFIGASLATFLAFLAYICYYPQSDEIRILPKYAYELFTIILSPLVLGGLWGNFCLDFKDQLKSTNQTLKGILISCLICFVEKMFLLPNYFRQIDSKQDQKGR
jgi:hypothetical protein